MHVYSATTVIANAGLDLTACMDETCQYVRQDSGAPIPEIHFHHSIQMDLGGGGEPISATVMVMKKSAIY